MSGLRRGVPAGRPATLLLGRLSSSGLSAPPVQRSGWSDVRSAAVSRGTPASHASVVSGVSGVSPPKACDGLRMPCVRRATPRRATLPRVQRLLPPHWSRWDLPPLRRAGCRRRSRPQHHRRKELAPLDDSNRTQDMTGLPHRWAIPEYRSGPYRLVKINWPGASTERREAPGRGVCGLLAHLPAPLTTPWHRTLPHARPFSHTPCHGLLWR